MQDCLSQSRLEAEGRSWKHGPMLSYPNLASFLARSARRDLDHGPGMYSGDVFHGLNVAADLLWYKYCSYVVLMVWITCIWFRTISASTTDTGTIYIVRSHGADADHQMLRKPTESKRLLGSDTPKLMVILGREVAWSLWGSNGVVIFIFSILPNIVEWIRPWLTFNQFSDELNPTIYRNLPGRQS